MPPSSARTFTHSATFDCYWQCTECGFQVAPIEKPNSDAYRVPAVHGPMDRRPVQSCDGCGETNTWANLREGAVVEALVAQADTRQMTRGARRSGLIKLVGLGVWLLVVALALRGSGALVLLPLAFGTAFVMLHAAYREYQSGERSRFASSWRHERRPGWRTRAWLDGALGGERGLRAPLSGRECLAYELGVRHDSDAEADPWSWTLLEQHSAPALCVEGVELGERPYLQLERRVYAQVLSAAACDELRKRGLDPSRPGYTLFETTVMAGEAVTVRAHAGGLVLQNE